MGGERLGVACVWDGHGHGRWGFGGYGVVHPRYEPDQEPEHGTAMVTLTVNWHQPQPASEPHRNRHHIARRVLISSLALVEHRRSRCESILPRGRSQARIITIVRPRQPPARPRARPDPT
ncbi:hypothetical protein Purlil1_8414 [Purpureocillium lilacinum]|uniref:Uncharacterized protein n=1 Tax=Purpureocillium lilacinum TaxID=33203 RepID=A0ABR0BTE6_PURLI|nr:hypothetical protein Purlil1_8414 [Purpureocillium lilacinum]